MSEIETIRREDRNPDIAWLAGFVEGEGCFYIGFCVCKDREIPRKTFRTIINITNTDARMMESVTEILEKLNVGFTVKVRRQASKKDSWNIPIVAIVQGQGRCLKLCSILLPYLYGKKEQCRQMIYAIEYRKALSEINGGNNRNSALIDDRVLYCMSKRLKELNSFRPNPFNYSMVNGKKIYVAKPSQTTRLAALSVDDIVGPVWRHTEGDNLPFAKAK